MLGAVYGFYEYGQIEYAANNYEIQGAASFAPGFAWAVQAHSKDQGYATFNSIAAFSAHGAALFRGRANFNPAMTASFRGASTARARATFSPAANFSVVGHAQYPIADNRTFIPRPRNNVLTPRN